ncbi:hypothetical protein J4Q44_G00159540 [Coregonus suidteri]|uniref:Uncharacterized protein n=1 Tax=Coregonus suidteri TaxID=861788 RepID=A0AAN8QSC6_9TELE
MQYPTLTSGGSLLSRPDIKRPELPFPLGQEDLHSPVEKVHPQPPLPLHLPCGHHPVVFLSLLVVLILNHVLDYFSH